MMRFLNYVRLYLKKRWSRRAEIAASMVYTVEEKLKYQRRRRAPNYFRLPKQRCLPSNRDLGGLHYSRDPLVSDEQREFLKAYEQEPTT